MKSLFGWIGSLFRPRRRIQAKQPPRTIIEEGKISKGGVNPGPTVPRPQGLPGPHAGIRRSPRGFSNNHTTTPRGRH